MVDIANDLDNFGFVGIFWGSSDLQFEFTLVLKDMEMHFGQRLQQKTWVLVDMVNGASPASNFYHFLSMSNLFHINWIWFSSEDFKLDFALRWTSRRSCLRHLDDQNSVSRSCPAVCCCWYPQHHPPGICLRYLMEIVCFFPTTGLLLKHLEPWRQSCCNSIATIVWWMATWKRSRVFHDPFGKMFVDVLWAMIQ